MDSQYDCNKYQRLSDVVGASNINYTELFLQCPDACAAVIGNGNPDIAGIGVIKSFPFPDKPLAVLDPLVWSYTVLLTRFYGDRQWCHTRRRVS